MSSDLLKLSAVDLLEDYRTKRVSPVEVTRAVLQRIDALNPVLNAFCFVAPDALAMAAASEARWMAGEPSGPLDGVPVSIKDILLTKRLADAARLEDGRSRRARGPTMRRRWRGCARAARCCRQEHHARVRLEGRHRQPAHRHHAQPVESCEDARRLVRRRRRGGRGGHGAR